MQKSQKKRIFCSRKAGVPAAESFHQSPLSMKAWGGISVPQLFFIFNTATFSQAFVVQHTQVQNIRCSICRHWQGRMGVWCRSLLWWVPPLPSGDLLVIASPGQGAGAEDCLSKTKRLKSVFQQWALCKVAASLWIMLFPDLSEKQHSSQLSLCQAHRPRNIIRGDILAGSLCQAWGKGFVLRKHDQKFNKWNCIQTRMLIQRCREEARRQGCTPTL